MTTHTEVKEYSRRHAFDLACYSLIRHDTEYAASVVFWYMDSTDYPKGAPGSRHDYAAKMAHQAHDVMYETDSYEEFEKAIADLGF